MNKLLAVLFVLSTFVVVGLSSTFIDANAIEAGETLKTVILDVDKMTCGMCPITVKRALKNVKGVKDVKVKYEGGGVGWAKVTYDTTQVKISLLTQASTNAGYPARLRQ